MYRVLLIALLGLAVPSVSVASKADAPEGKEKDNGEQKDKAAKDDGPKAASVFETEDGKRAQLVFLVNSPPFHVGQIVVAVLVLALLGLVMFQVMMLRSDMERLLKK